MRNFVPIISAIVMVFFPHLLRAQVPPSLTWQKSLGGSADDMANCVRPAFDGGFIVAGSSNSNDGDITSNQGQKDFCLIKINEIGNLEWEHSYGGTGSDEAYTVVQTLDSGYAVSGKSNSHNGDVTGYHGGSDFWLVKTNKQGVLQWQKAYGGSMNDAANSMQLTSDGGFVLAGITYSNNGNVSGNHGMGDVWIIKLDQNGNLQWQKTFGGSNYDVAADIKQTNDSGYIVAGYSLSNDGNLTINHGQEDYWFFKLDKNGNLQWQRTMGGTGGDCANAVQQTIDGGYLICGFSHSKDMDVTGSHGAHDIWIVKTNQYGSPQWTHCLGGSDGDDGIDVKQSADGTIIALGYTSSDNDDVNGNHGLDDFWLTGLDTAGNLLWEKPFGGSNEDIPTTVQILSNGQYILSGKTNSNNGDVSGNHGGFDSWIVKLNTVCQNIFYSDADGDGYGDPNTQLVACTSPVGYVTDSTDCNDANPMIHPGATEICNNSLDDDCNGQVDETCPTFVYYADLDSDTYGNANSSITSLSPSPPAGFVVDNTDCDDNNSSVHISLLFYIDADEDGFGSLATTLLCESAAPAGYSTNNTDCNDINASIHPEAIEVCNGVDDDCNAIADDGLTFITYFSDNDSDGFGSSSNPGTLMCSNPGAGYSNTNTDCDDTNSTINPGVTEICNNIDDNCNNQIDEGVVTATIIPSGTVVICSGSNITLSANTGTGFLYQWKKNGLNISGATTSTYKAKVAGSFTVRVSAGSCSATSVATTTTVNPPPNATITPSGTVSTCPGVSLTMNANTGGGLTYQWQKSGVNISGATNSSFSTIIPGYYKVIVTDSYGCTKISSITTFKNYAAPSVKITMTGNFCSTGSVTLSAKLVSGYSYQWFKDNVVISGATGTSYIATLAGTYYYRAITPDGCSAISTSKMVSSCRLSNEIESPTTVFVYPNPTHGTFTIEMHLQEKLNGTAQIELINIYGAVVLAEDANINEGTLMHAIRMKDEMHDALYIIKIIVGDQVFFQRIIYQQ